MYSLILKHYSDEIYELSEYIVLILLSLNKLDIDNVEAKNIIFSKIIQLKKINNINYGILTNIINTTINNLKLLDELLSLFGKYIDKVKKHYKKDNVHNTNFELNIQHKYDNILNEYNRYSNKLNNLIDYYNTSTNSIIQQIDNSQLLSFFLHQKSNT